MKLTYNCTWVLMASTLMKLKQKSIFLLEGRFLSLNMNKVLAVGFGGFLGATLRYVVTCCSVRWFGEFFPLGTLLVNVLGGLLMGFIMGICADVPVISPTVQLFLTTGILGGLTTFSTFSYETVTLFSNGEYLKGGLNAGLNLFFALIAVCVGKAAANAVKAFACT